MDKGLYSTPPKLKRADPVGGSFKKPHAPPPKPPSFASTHRSASLTSLDLLANGSSGGSGGSTSSSPASTIAYPNSNSSSSNSSSPIRQAVNGHGNGANGNVVSIATIINGSTGSSPSTSSTSTSSALTDMVIQTRPSRPLTQITKRPPTAIFDLRNHSDTFFIRNGSEDSAQSETRPRFVSSASMMKRNTSLGAEPHVETPLVKPTLRHVEVPKEEAPKQRKNEKDQLFEYVVVVGLVEAKSVSTPSKSSSSPADAYAPSIQYRYPPASGQEYLGKKETSLLASIPQFCFPDISSWRPVKDYQSETFAFVLTELDSSRRFGYCRRLLPEGEGKRMPEVYCIVSRVGSFGLFSQILDIVETRRKYSSSAVFAFLKSVAAIPFPDPGESVVVKAFSPLPESLGMDEYRLTRPNDLLALEHVSFAGLFRSLAPAQILQIFASLLLERRIIFCSKSLTKLSEITHAVLALLYPFEWQHVLIPILPRKLIDFCCSPTPFVVGVLSDTVSALNDLPMEEVIIVDLDNGQFLRQDVNDAEKIPSSLQSPLDKALRAATKPGASNINESISEAFLNFMVELMSRYRHHFKHIDDDTVRFNINDFLASCKSKDVRKVLELFTQSQMFHAFIQERENALSESSTPIEGQVEMFEQLIDLNEGSGESSMARLAQLRDLNIKQFKSGIKAVGGRFTKLVKNIAK